MKTLGIAILSCTFFLMCGGHRQAIPQHVLADLKKMTYKNDINGISGLRVVPMHHTHTTTHQVMTGGSLIRKGSRIGTANPALHLDDDGSLGVGGSSHNMSGVLEVINDPKQASNSCEQREICVPVPVDEQDASVFIFPQCIELPQCLGSCCDSLQRCHPRHVVRVMVAVSKWEYYGNGELRELNKTFVPMEKHMDCGCEKCQESSIECKGKHVRKDCGCRCPNEDEAGHCNSPWKWSNEECKCECPITAEACGTDEILNEEQCKCFPRRAVATRNRHRSRSTDIGRAPEVLQGSAAGLPSLKMNRRNDRSHLVYH